MTIQEKLEQAIAQYRDAQQQLAWWQERVIFLAGRVEALQELADNEPLPSTKILDADGNVLIQSKQLNLVQRFQDSE